MNRFEKKPKVIYFLQLIKLPLLAFLILLCLFLYGVTSVNQSTTDKQQANLENSISKDITHCYAVEGTYPPSLTYLKEHYGLIYDTNLFFVDYRFIGSNILPDVTIIKKIAANK